MTPDFVAPLAGSVDRNHLRKDRVAQPQVAPLAGSVDRNYRYERRRADVGASLPSRGAWIEIFLGGLFQQGRLGRSPRGERG